MNSQLLFRSWFYFRQGWSVYFAFAMAAINTLTVTYYLAIEKYPTLNAIFPSFLQYMFYAILIGIPVLTFTVASMTATGLVLGSALSFDPSHCIFETQAPI